MTFLTILKNFYGYFGVTDPVSLLASKGGITKKYVYIIAKRADLGVGFSTGELDPKLAGWLIFLSEEFIREREVDPSSRNPVAEFLREKLSELEKNKNEEERKKVVDEKSNVVKAELVPVTSAGDRSGKIVAQVMQNMRSVFKYERIKIELDKKGVCDPGGGSLMVYGKACVMIGRIAGVQIITPETIVVGEKTRSNPFIEYDDNGMINIVNIRKVSVYVQPDGIIRYKDYKFRKSVKAYLAERAINLIGGKSTQYETIPKDVARWASSEDVEIWNKESSGKVGAPKYHFVEVPNSTLGVAINVNDPNWNSRKFMKDFSGLDKTILDRFDTQAERRATEFMIPEYLTPLPGATKDSATVEVDRPTRGGFIHSMITKVAQAIMEDNPSGREEALASFAETLNLKKDAIAIEEAPDIPEPVTDPGEGDISSVEDLKVESVETPVEEIPDPDPPKSQVNPLPDRKTIGNLKKWISENIASIDEEFYIGLLGVAEARDEDDLLEKISGDNVKPIWKFVRDRLDNNPSLLNGEVTSDDYLKSVLEIGADSPERLDAILSKLGYPEDVDPSALAPDAIKTIYEALHK